MRKTILAAIAVALLLTGCFGSFRLVRGVHGFNKDVSHSKFVQELVFLGMVIIPVYELASLGDALIFNTIEFWGGDSRVSRREVPLEDGTVATLVREGDDVRVIHGDRSYLLQRTPEGMRVLRGGAPVAEVAAVGHRLVVVDGQGRLAHVATTAELEDLQRLAEQASH
jgi:hypothetical protein